MSRKKRFPAVPIDAAGNLGWPRSQGEWDRGPDNEAQEISLAQARTAEAVAERCLMAERYCTQAEEWLNGTKAGNRSEGVAKSALRDAIVALVEVWLGMPGSEALALVRRLIVEAKDAC